MPFVHCSVCTILHSSTMKKTGENKIESIGTFLIVQWLGLRAFTAGAWVQSLVGELRKIPGMCSVEKKKKNLKWQEYTEELYQRH